MLCFNDFMEEFSLEDSFINAISVKNSKLSLEGEFLSLKESTNSDWLWRRGIITFNNVDRISLDINILIQKESPKGSYDFGPVEIFIEDNFIKIHFVHAISKEFKHHIVLEGASIEVECAAFELLEPDP